MYQPPFENISRQELYIRLHSAHAGCQGNRLLTAIPFTKEIKTQLYHGGFHGLYYNTKRHRVSRTSKTRTGEYEKF